MILFQPFVSEPKATNERLDERTLGEMPSHRFIEWEPSTWHDRKSNRPMLVEHGSNFPYQDDVNWTGFIELPARFAVWLVYVQPLSDLPPLV